LSALKERCSKEIAQVKALDLFDEELDTFKTLLKRKMRSSERAETLYDDASGYIAVQTLQDAYEKDKWGLEELLKGEENDEKAETMVQKAIERYWKQTLRPFRLKDKGYDERWENAESTAKTQAPHQTKRILAAVNKIEALDELYTEITSRYYASLPQQIKDFAKSALNKFLLS
jgi:hypothetical protein